MQEQASMSLKRQQEEKRMEEMRAAQSSGMKLDYIPKGMQPIARNTMAAEITQEAQMAPR